jgi:hypothetical protein
MHKKLIEIELLMWRSAALLISSTHIYQMIHKALVDSGILR